MAKRYEEYGPKTRARIDHAVDVEMTRYARTVRNITQACEDGRISEHDRDERIARAEHWSAGVIAHLRGEPKPPMRERKPLDDPDAGKVG